MSASIASTIVPGARGSADENWSPSAASASESRQPVRPNAFGPAMRMCIRCDAWRGAPIFNRRESIGPWRHMHRTGLKAGFLKYPILRKK
jgi:hypothetical protein